MKTSLVVLAAGMGSRYGGLKQLDSMDQQGHTLLDFSVYDAYKVGFDEVVFIIRESIKDEFHEKIGKPMSSMLSVKYVMQDSNTNPLNMKIEREKPLGTGHALYCAKDVVKSNFAIINADDFYGRETLETIHRFLIDNKIENEHILAPFELQKTISEKGSVSRGVCSVEQGKLQAIVEETDIITKDGKIFVRKDNSLEEMDPKTLVSMNCWGFKPSIFDIISEDLTRFLKNDYLENIEKSEYFLPTVVDRNLNKTMSVDVKPSMSQWFGVTYQEDKIIVMNEIKKLKEEGVYPEKLWEQ
ncbi:sugar phosphate nucleotidyltransferase [Erysipelothrix urinaevulpis]|uniref:sugar phosphate nucleotidyltransferase n=1 Tax=Erysipelothrix urinaevulpis TaxID=2683717 RepID=UPI001358CEDC|nr:sugar phosphate nucleotidyltransferase [Erysipelothrix urinaevulpis]